jgi:hypothetical protein
MINIFTFQFNDASFLRFQYKTFRHFIKEDHKLVCINNAYDNLKDKEEIRATAAELGIEHHFPQNVNYAKGGWAHQTAINWTWRNIIMPNNDINIILDHDMFLIKNFSCANMQEDIWGIMQGRGNHIKYFHPGFMVINNTLKDKETVDFTGEVIDGEVCDSGGNWHHYIKSHPDLKIKSLMLQNVCPEQGNMNVLPPEVLGTYDGTFDPIQICEDYMIHFRNGSNWARNPNIGIKKIHLSKIIDFYMNK